jgi:hypothetical protein
MLQCDIPSPTAVVAVSSLVSSGSFCDFIVYIDLECKTNRRPWISRCIRFTSAPGNSGGDIASCV